MMVAASAKSQTKRSAAVFGLLKPAARSASKPLNAAVSHTRSLDDVTRMQHGLKFEGVVHTPNVTRYDASLTSDGAGFMGGGE